MNSVTFFGGSLDGGAIKTPNDPPLQIKADSETYILQGYDGYTWRYELREEQRAETK
jgi:hypothetical protein